MIVKKEDIDFMPDTYAAEVESTPIAVHAILWTSAIFLIIAIIWANLAVLDEVAHANGKVIPSSQIQVIQNLEGGILAEILVKAGDQVKKKQSLIRMDDTRFASSFDEGVLSSQALQARIVRLEAEISGHPFEAPEKFPPEHAEIIEDELQLYNSRQQEFGSSIAILNQQLNQHRQALAALRAEEENLVVNAELASQELSKWEPLVKTGA
ncbi:MAG: hemolysin secretion protein D, partial [Gammaproteobacteria bacterium]|nr:hemolysin secretion protein D [Gammaproteobacteria bacterium]